MSESGHNPTFSALKNIVGFPPETKHSAPSVGKRNMKCEAKTRLAEDWVGLRAASEAIGGQVAAALRGDVSGEVVKIDNGA
jgi:hypothetical protein